MSLNGPKNALHVCWTSGNVNNKMQLLQASGLCSPVLCWNLILKYNSDPFVPIFSFCVGFCRPSNYNSFPLQGAMTAGLGMDRSEPGAGDK